MFLVPFSRVIGLMLIGALVLYILVMHRLEPETLPNQVAVTNQSRRFILTNGAIAIGGIASLIVGSQLLVDAAVSVARLIGASETIIGLTIVAVGTSLPELISSVQSARRGRPELALGNVIGSNIYNLFGIIGIAELIAPSTAPRDIVYLHGPIMLATTLWVAWFFWTKPEIGRIEGRQFLLAYAGYIVLLILLASI